MAAPTQEEIDRVLAAYENAKQATEYAGSIKCEMAHQSGDNYTMVWSEQQNG